MTLDNILRGLLVNFIPKDYIIFDVEVLSREIGKVTLKVKAEASFGMGRQIFEKDFTLEIRE